MKSSIKMISRIICLILAMVMSMAVIGCGGESASVNNGATQNGSTDSNTNNNYDDGNGSGTTDDDGKNVIDTEDYETTDPEDLNYFGQHDYTAPESENKWLVKDGATQYILVEPAEVVEVNNTPVGLPEVALLMA